MKRSLITTVLALGSEVVVLLDIAQTKLDNDPTTTVDPALATALIMLGAAVVVLARGTKANNE